VLLNRTHRPWLIACVLILAVSTAIYIPYAMTAREGPTGGSFWGLTFGIVGFGMMLFAGLLSARKKVPVWRVGRAQTWLRGHLWLGFLALPLILFHSGFHFGGSLTTVLMVLLIFVVGSGVLGAVLQNHLPRTMMLQLPLETVYEEIGHVRKQLAAEAAEAVAAVCGPLDIPSEVSLASPIAPSASARPSSAIVAAEVEEVDAEATARLREFYLREFRGYLDAPKKRDHPLFDRKRSETIFEHLRTLLPASLGEAVDDLENICEEERQLNRQEQLHHWLHWWLLVHVPVSFALLLLGAVHAVMALFY
jgi:hypothetical protein